MEKFLVILAALARFLIKFAVAMALVIGALVAVSTIVDRFSNE